MMKKLTDEEIAKALLQQIEYGTGIPYINEWKQVKTVKFTEILDFIHRLQSENAGLKERGEIVINSLHETIDKQKSEIERLKNAYKEGLEQGKFDSQVKIAELQKQVGELKAENTELYKEHTTLIAGSILKKQNIAKDTAKEICDLILEHWEKKQLIECDWLRVAIAEKYGVELE